MDVNTWTRAWLHRGNGDVPGFPQAGGAALLRDIEELAAKLDGRETKSDIEAAHNLKARVLLRTAHALEATLEAEGVMVHGGPGRLFARSDARRGLPTRVHPAVEALANTFERLGRAMEANKEEPPPVVGLGTRMLPILKKAEGVLEECLE